MTEYAYDGSPHYDQERHMTVELACGHVAEIPDNPHVKPGDWVSCWALMYPSEDSCQTQRKVTEVTR